MEIRQQTLDDVTVVQLLGRLDELATSEVELAFNGVIEDGPRQVVLDLSGVEYISSSGLRILLMFAKAVERTDGHLKLCSLSPFVAEVFEISNFASIFEVHSDLEQALAAFERQS